MTGQQKRFVSLDVFRGMTIALMILVNTPGTWAHVYAPLRHAKWHGCTLTDLVFPFFLFIVGTAMRFSFRKYDFILSTALTRKILRRVFIIFLCGFFLSAFPFISQDWDWSHFRIMGVLQRIGLAYGCAAFLVLVLHRNQIIKVSGIILLTYWFLLLFFGWINGVEPYGLEFNLPRMVDLAILGNSHLYRGAGIPFDPEGLLSTIPAVVTVLIGYLTGTMLQGKIDGIENVVCYSTEDLERLVKYHERQIKYLRSHDIPCEPMQFTEELVDNEQAIENNYIVNLKHNTGRKVRSSGPIFKISTGEVQLKSAPMLGENTAEVLISIGYKNSEIDNLISKSIIGKKL